MTKYEIARWLTPGLTNMRLVFTTFGGSVHGNVVVEKHVDEEWVQHKSLGAANGCPQTKGEKISNEHINQFTGEAVE